MSDLEFIKAMLDKIDVDYNVMEGPGGKVLAITGHEGDVGAEADFAFEPNGDIRAAAAWSSAGA